jgi:hypothetical protein
VNFAAITLCVASQRVVVVVVVVVVSLLLLLLLLFISLSTQSRNFWIHPRGGCHNELSTAPPTAYLFINNTLATIGVPLRSPPAEKKIEIIRMQLGRTCVCVSSLYGDIDFWHSN